MDPVMHCITLPIHSSCSQQILVSFATEIHTTSIDFLTPRSYALSWKLYQGDCLNLPDHRYKRRCCSLIPVESNSLPLAHAQTTKTYYKHQDSRIKKAQVLKIKTSATLILKILLKEIKIFKTKVIKGDCLQAFKMIQSMSMLVKTQDRKMAKTTKTYKEKILRSRNKSRSRKTMTKAKDQRSHSMKE
ncbi:hypothetical protein Tco_1472435 [Tanacetum coccineum]